ncbi:recombinase family protein [Priestia megaterium]|uniref:recombinase family protein n=1 Tax=Priestia megaterium TaxID=1404 RepID=UPI002E1A343B|nr:recombinase family protein [Priestia megaterium]
MEKQFTVKANGTTSEGKKIWMVFDKAAEKFLPQFEGGRFALQDIAKQLNEGTLQLEAEEQKTAKTVGYMRISTQHHEQSFDRQEAQLKAMGVTKIYQDRMSGSKMERPQLQQMLEELEAGDTIIIVAIDRLSRSTKDLLDIVEIIKNKGASLKSINDSWLDTTDASPMGDFLLTVMGALGQMERAMTQQRINEGLKVAKAKGVRLGRPKKSTTKVQHALDLYSQGGHTVKQIVEITGVSKATLYRKIKELELEIAENQGS